MPHTTRDDLATEASRALALLTVCGLAGLAGWISYHHMLLLARRSGESGLDAHAFPVTVDGLDVMCVLVLLADRRTHRRSGWLPWTVLAIGTAASIGANIAVAPDNLIARGISGWPAIALLAAVKMLAHLFEPTPPSPPPAAPDEVSPTLVATPDQTPPTSPDDDPGHRDDDHEIPHGGTHGIALRIPTGDAARARWQRIWDATRHLDAATEEVAAAHGVSLRTLQFIRAAGERGHLELPQPPAAVTTSTEPHHDDTSP